MLFASKVPLCHSASREMMQSTVCVQSNGHFENAWYRKLARNTFDDLLIFSCLIKQKIRCSNAKMCFFLYLLLFQTEYFWVLNKARHLRMIMRMKYLRNKLLNKIIATCSPI